VLGVTAAGAYDRSSWQVLPVVTVLHDKLGLALVQPAGSADKPLVMLRLVAALPSSVVKVRRTARLCPTATLIGPAGSTVARTVLTAGATVLE
jgi:NAD/NADP transhydrogenase beta subunit